MCVATRSHLRAFSREIFPWELLVGRGPTSAKNGRLSDITIPGFVPLQEFCSPIRLQPSSVCLHWPTYERDKFACTCMPHRVLVATES